MLSHSLELVNKYLKFWSTIVLELWKIQDIPHAGLLFLIQEIIYNSVCQCVKRTATSSRRASRARQTRQVNIPRVCRAANEL